MATLKKKAIVSRKVSDEQVQDAKRWQAFVVNCQIAWDNLSEEWKDFYETMAPNGADSDKIVKAIDLAIARDEIK